MTHDRIERRLRAELPADEARYVARPLPATVGEARALLGQRSVARTPLVMAIAIAAVAVAAVVGWASWRAMVTDGSGIGTGDVPTATASPSASPPPSLAGTTGCRATDFAVASDAWDSAAGSRGTRVVFRVVASTASCSLSGSVAGRITDASGAVLVEGASPSRPAPADLPSGTQIELGVAWSNWCGPEPSEPQLSLRLAGDDSWIPIVPPGGSAILVPPCNGIGQPTALNVTGFEASDRAPIDG